MNPLDWNCLVIDAGARYGLHPSWRDARDICEFHLFEPEPKEVNRLTIRYQGSPNITVHAKALTSKTETRKLVMRKHLGLSNLDGFDPDLSNLHQDFNSSAKETNRIDISAVSINEFFFKSRVDFLKLDAEGSDLEILKGASKHLNDSILGVRINVAFVKFSKTLPTFTDFDLLMRDFNFGLHKIETVERVCRAQGLFPLTNNSGSLLGGDAIWTRSPNEVYSKNSNELSVIYALFLYLNGLEDVALQFLVDTPKQSNLDLTEAKDNPFITLLETKTLAHLASALASGWWDTKEITDTYSKLFDKEFPSKEELYLRLYP